MPTRHRHANRNDDRNCHHCPNNVRRGHADPILHSPATNASALFRLTSTPIQQPTGLHSKLLFRTAGRAMWDKYHDFLTPSSSRAKFDQSCRTRSHTTQPQDEMQKQLAPYALRKGKHHIKAARFCL